LLEGDGRELVPARMADEKASQVFASPPPAIRAAREKIAAGSEAGNEAGTTRQGSEVGSTFCGLAPND